MKKWLVMACCAMAAVPLMSAAEIYKWKDASGKMHYSDTPPPSKIPYSTLSGKKSVQTEQAMPAMEAAPADAKAPAKAAAAAAGKDDPAQKKAEEEKTAREAEIKRLQAEKAAMEKSIREQNCANARKRIAQFEQGGRIYTVDEKGERHYYGDAEIGSELERARADVEANCQ